MMNLQSFRQIFQSHKVIDRYHEYYPYLKLSYQAVRSVNSLLEKKKRTPLSVVETGMHLKFLYDDFLDLKNGGSHPVYMVKDWFYVYDFDDCGFIYDFLISDPDTKLISSIEKGGDKIVFYSLKNEIKIAIGLYNFGKSYKFIKVEHKSEIAKVKKIITDLIYKKLGSLIKYKSDSDNRIELHTEDKEKVFTIPIAERVYDDLKAYMNHGYQRSIIFYGPPGSGKSNIIKYICHLFNLKTLVINPDVAQQITMNIIDLTQPDIIVMDDIDYNNNDDSAALSLMEKLNGCVKIILASANVVTKLGPAFQRPGRFDELIEIKNLDPIVHGALVNHDSDCHQFTKDFPTAYIVEFMKRVKVKGRDYALANSQDIIDRVTNLAQHNYSLKSEE